MHEAASEAIRAELGPGERILAEGPAAVWPEVNLALTTERLVWAMTDMPEAGAPSMRFDQIVRHTDDGSRVELSERDPEYAGTDPSNPYGETDAVFVFGSHEDDLRKEMARRITEAKT